MTKWLQLLREFLNAFLIGMAILGVVLVLMLYAHIKAGG